MRVLLLTCTLYLFSNGEKFSNRQPRIIGGNPAPIAQYSFAAAINVQTTTSKFFCGGSFFHQQYIITAGQCVHQAVLFTVHLGSAKLSDEDSTRLVLATSDYFLHEDFNPDNFQNDIGLIKLRISVQYTDFIQPIQPLALSPLTGYEQLRAIGWGQTSDMDSSLSEELHVTHVTTLTNNECKIIYGNQITETMVCVEGNFNEGTCHGDTGTPLLHSYSRYSNIHVGIASFVSGNGCESTDPSGYTRTYPYLRWISNLTGSTVPP